jgi:hypothetical protein
LNRLELSLRAELRVRQCIPHPAKKLLIERSSRPM